MRIDSNEIARALAQVYGGQYYWLTAPALVSEEHAREAITQHIMIAPTLAQMRNTRVVLVSVAPFPSALTQLLVDLKYMRDVDRNALKAKGAIGEIIGWPFDAQGCVLDLPVEPIGMSIEHLRRVAEHETVIGIAGVESTRTNAILGALRGKLINVLITDHQTAEAVIKRSSGQDGT